MTKLNEPPIRTSLIEKLEDEAFNPTYDDRMGKWIPLLRAKEIVGQHEAESFQESSHLYHALQMLTQLKAHKDKFGKDEHYEKMQPLAWEQAFAAMRDAADCKDEDDAKAGKPPSPNIHHLTTEDAEAIAAKIIPSGYSVERMRLALSSLDKSQWKELGYASYEAWAIELATQALDGGPSEYSVMGEGGEDRCNGTPGLSEEQACSPKAPTSTLDVPSPANASEIPVVTNWNRIHRHFIELWHQMKGYAIEEYTPKEFADSQTHELQAYFHAPEPVSGWQPIETLDDSTKGHAPILLVDAANGGCPLIAHKHPDSFEWKEWMTDTWLDLECHTHWMPIPPKEGQ